MAREEIYSDNGDLREVKLSDNEAAIAGHELSAMSQVHPFSQLNDPHADFNKTLEGFKSTASKYHAAVLGDGVTIPAKANANPLEVGNKEWYGVGGARNVTTGKREPSIAIPARQFTKGHALGAVVRADAENQNRKRSPGGLSPVHAGGWNENGEAVMDNSNVYRSKDRALGAAEDRGEDAIFDAKNIDNIYTSHGLAKNAAVAK